MFGIESSVMTRSAAQELIISSDSSPAHDQCLINTRGEAAAQETCDGPSSSTTKIRRNRFIMLQSLVSLFVTNRYGESDACSGAPSAALHPDAPAVRFDDAARDGQAHSQPSRPSQTSRAIARRAEEFVENALAQMRRYPTPFILYGHPYHLVCRQAG